MRIKLIQIRRYHDKQTKLLIAYRKLLEEQINLINAALSLARRLKPGA